MVDERGRGMHGETVGGQPGGQGEAGAARAHRRDETRERQRPQTRCVITSSRYYVEAAAVRIPAAGLYAAHVVSRSRSVEIPSGVHQLYPGASAAAAAAALTPTSYAHSRGSLRRRRADHGNRINRIYIRIRECARICPRRLVYSSLYGDMLAERARGSSPPLSRVRARALLLRLPICTLAGKAGASDYGCSLLLVEMRGSVYAISNIADHMYVGNGNGGFCAFIRIFVW